MPVLYDVSVAIKYRTSLGSHLLPQSNIIMDIKELIYITTIAKEKNLSRAGKVLGVSQPTLSAFLSGLEDRLETDLFYREKKELIPSPAGKIYLEAAEKIIALKEHTYLSIHRLSTTESKVLRIAASPLRGSSMFGTVYTAFSKRFPDIRLELKEAYMSSILNLVADGSVDFGLGAFADSESDRFDYITTSLEEIVIAAPAYYRELLNVPEEIPVTDPDSRSVLNSLPSVPISSFKDSAFVRLSKGNAIRIVSDGILASAGINPLNAYETGNNLIIENMVKQGVGVGFLPATRVIINQKDIAFFRTDTRYYVNLGLILKKGTEISEAIRYFAFLAYQADRKTRIYHAPTGSEPMSSIIKEFSE